MVRIFSCLLLLLALGAIEPAFAQTISTPAKSAAKAAAEPEQVVGQVYTYVEQMPQLPGGGGPSAVVTAIQSRVHYPVLAIRQHIQGQVMVGFLVGKQGEVQNVKIIQGIGGGCDEAAIAATRELPRFIPGTQAGKPVVVSFTVPITFKIPDSFNSDSTLYVYTLVNQMPQLTSGGGTAAIAKAVQQSVVMPAEIPAPGSPNKVFVSFMVGAFGVVHKVKVVRSLNATCDAAAVAAVEKLPRLVGGKLNGQPVAVSLTIPVLFAQP